QLFLGLCAANEELLWRRLLLGELLIAGPVAALALSSAGFAIAHRRARLLHVGTGSAFGALYLATGLLSASIAAHWAYNALVARRRAFRRGPAVMVAGLSAAPKRFGAVTALDRVSFAIDEGDVLALLGANGAGKTTAIALLLGLRVPDEGSVRLFGLEPRRVEARRRIGVAPQEVAFPPTLRVHEVIELVRRHYEEPIALEAVAARFGLQRLLRRQLGGLSGGERRLVAVALAFAGGPELVVLDEPTAGLDAEARDAVWEAVRAHAHGGGTVLLTTHH